MYLDVLDRAVAHIDEHGYQSPIDVEIMQFWAYGAYMRSANRRFKKNN